MKRVGIIFFVLIMCSMMSSVAYAEIFKWVDENGKVHYSDRKISVKAEKVNVTTGTKTIGLDTQQVEQRLLEQQKYVNFLQAERLERQEKRQEAEQAEQKKRKLCSTLQDQLKSYSEGSYRWYELDESTGERKFLSDDQIEAKKQELQTEIKSSC